MMKPKHKIIIKYLAPVEVLVFWKMKVSVVMQNDANAFTGNARKYD